jgi:hypothetical protein
LKKPNERFTSLRFDCCKHGDCIAQIDGAVLEVDDERIEAETG